MIDLDALKAANLHMKETSENMLAMHRWRESVRLHGEMLVKWLRDHPGATSDEAARADLAACLVADRRVA